MSATVESVNVGVVRDVPWGKLKRSAIDKRPVAESVWVSRVGLLGDEVADTVFHGGETKAVYAFAAEDLERWAAELGRPFGPGAFGENLTVRGLDLATARSGERWAVGTTVLEMTTARIPCSVFQGFVGERQWVRRFAADGAPGAYFRVLQEGHVRPGDAIEVLRGGDGPTMRELLHERMPVPARTRG